MNLRNRSAWVRAAGLAAVLGLVACDSGSADSKAEKKADPAAKAAADAKVVADKVAADAKVAAEKAAAEAKVVAEKAAADAKLAAEKALYEGKCKSCHAIDGKGSKAMQKNNIPDLSNADWQGKHDRAKIVAVVTDGIKDTKMGSFKAKLKPEEIEAIAVYVKTMK